MDVYELALVEHEERQWPAFNHSNLHTPNNSIFNPRHIRSTSCLSSLHAGSSLRPFPPPLIRCLSPLSSVPCIRSVRRALSIESDIPHQCQFDSQRSLSRMLRLHSHRLRLKTPEGSPRHILFQ